MPRINLLPWREEERKRRQRDFGLAMGGAVLAAIAVIMLTMLAYSQMISAQERRNARLTEEINELQRSIEEIDGLERQKERLLARMEIIDELTRQLPEGVYLTGIKQSGSRIEVRGVAQSSTRVSALMRQIDASEWLADPEVERVETTTAGASRQAEFIVYLKQRRKGDDAEEDV